MSRERTVFPTREIAHLWAHKVHAGGRNPQINLHWAGDSLYSYGWYEIARHVTSPVDGRPGVLIHTYNYSNTTARHLGMARQSIPPGIEEFNVLLCSRRGTHNPQTWVKDYEDRIVEGVKGVARAREHKQWKLDTLLKLVDEANRFVAFFGLKHPRFEVADLDGIQAQAAQWEKVRREREKKEAAKLERQHKKEIREYVRKLEDWKRGDLDRAPYPPMHMIVSGGRADYLRVRGDEVQTSQGASVPVDHARRLYKIVKGVREKGEVWTPNGHTIHIGHYQVNRIEADGTILAGCHRIEWAEVERVGEQLGE